MIHTRRGPSRYLVAVLRELLRGTRTVPALATATGLAERTIRAQIAHLLANQAARRIATQRPAQPGGVRAVYAPVVVEVA